MGYSMTGYGRGEADSEFKKIIIEIKSVNHRYNDIIIKMPKKLFRFEDKMKSLIKKSVHRGRVEVYITLEETKGDDCVIAPNFKVLDQYYAALNEIKEKYSIEKSVDLHLMAKYPDAIKVEYKEEDEELLWELVQKSLTEALVSLVDMRKIEGEKLIVDIKERLDVLRKTLILIEENGEEIIKRYHVKMKDRIKELLEDKVELDEQRLAHEVAFFADKTNITEEIVRLRSHLEQFENIMSGNGQIGRKLDFLTQEVNREVNTIGSKSPDFDISNHVIELKSELEKIREQIQNIE